MTIMFKPGNQIKLDDSDPFHVVIAEKYGIDKETVLTVEDACLVRQIGGNPVSVGHPQWVDVRLPNGDLRQFSGAFFKIAPGGRMNEVNLDTVMN